MSMSEPFQPNLPHPSDDEGSAPDDDLTVDAELAADGEISDDDQRADDDLDVDGTPAAEGETGADDDLADLPENTVFRTPEPGDRLSPEDLER